MHRRLVLPCIVTMVVFAPRYNCLGVSTPPPSCLIRPVVFLDLVRHLRGLLPTLNRCRLPSVLVRSPMGNRPIVRRLGLGTVFNWASSIPWLLLLIVFL